MSKDNSQQKAYLALADDILKGRYRPGARVSARAAAATMGTSITPIREAILKLEALGALQAGAGGWLRIPEHRPEEVLQLYRLRTLVEGQAALEAAALTTPTDVARLRQLDAEAQRCYEAARFREIVELNEEFHFTIYRAARNPVLLDTITLLWLRCGPLLPVVYGFRKVVRDQADRAGPVHPTHVAIVAALEARDGEAARDALARDIETGLAGYRALTVGLEDAIAELSEKPVRPVRRRTARMK